MLSGGGKLAAAYFTTKMEKSIFSCSASFEDNLLQKRYLSTHLAFRGKFNFFIGLCEFTKSVLNFS